MPIFDGAVQRTNSAPTPQASVASVVVKATPGQLFGFSVYSSISQWIQIHDATALPANTAVPLQTWPIAAGQTIGFDWGIYGRGFVNGIVIANSTTAATLTTGAANCLIDGQYR